MIMQFWCFGEQTQLLVKETSSRLGKYFVWSLPTLYACDTLNIFLFFFTAAAEAGFQDISPDVIKKLMAVPIKSSARS